MLLADIGANSTVVVAGILHDTLDDLFMSYDYILRTFGSGVADLVEGVSKLSQLSKLARENNTACKTIEADRLHTMFLAMVDARAVLIKLADRLHNMLTLYDLPLVKQQRFAKETLEIFTPLANRLGISSWKLSLKICVSSISILISTTRCLLCLRLPLYFSNSYNIGQHDYSVRLRAAQKFLQDGDKVVPIFFISCESSVPFECILFMHYLYAHRLR